MVPVRIKIASQNHFTALKKSRQTVRYFQVLRWVMHSSRYKMWIGNFPTAHNIQSVSLYECEFVGALLLLVIRVNPQFLRALFRLLFRDLDNFSKITGHKCSISHAIFSVLLSSAKS